MIELEAWLAVRALGWALVHFLWQGALVAALLELALFGLRGASSELRYLVRCGALLLMAAAPALTFVVIRDAQPRLAEMEGVTQLAAAPAAAPWLADAWPGLVVLAWALGAALLCARLVRDYSRVRRLAPDAADGALPREWQARFDALARAMGVRAVARVVTSARLGAPVVIGALRPVVLLPVRVLTGLTPEQITAVIAHELAHVRRHDYLVNLLQSAVEAALFYHPAVWWVSRGIRAEREYCCDDAAVRVCADRVAYARALTTLESWRSARPAVGMSTLGGSLMIRVQRLIGIQNESPRPGGALSFLGALLGASMLAAVALGNSAPVQDAEDLQALKARIEALRTRIDELAELTERLHAANRARAVDDVPEPRVMTLHELLQGLERTAEPDAERHARTLHELLQGAGRAQSGRAADPGHDEHARRLHELLQGAHRAQDQGDVQGALRALQGVDGAKIRLQVHEALKRLGRDAGRDETDEQSADALGRWHEVLQLDPDQAQRLQERVKTALERAARARELHPQGFQRLHERALQALQSGAYRRFQGLDVEQLHDALLRAQESGALLRLHGMDSDELREHLQELQESGALRRFRLNLDGLLELHENEGHEHQEPEADHHPAPHASGGKIV
jgi:beta-lactamase regulating signal transducer with metallopeptidase domain